MSYNSKYTGAEVESLLDAANGKQDKIEDLDAIRSGAAAGATALQSVPSEYITEGELEQKGYLTAVPSEYVTETELSNKGYATTAQLDNKVDKVSGKQLSTEDFTTALKTKLQGLTNYDDTAISDAVASLQAQINTLVSGNANDAINSFNEIIAFLEGIKDTQDLASIIASIEQQIAGKMDKVTLATVATSGSYNDLSNKPTIPSAVTESTVSGWGFTKNTGTYSKPSTGIPKSDLASAVQASLGKADTALQSVPNTYATNEYVDNKLATSLEFYRTRFTFQELVDAKYSGGLIQGSGKTELAQAITLGKTIVMDYDSMSGVEGHILCNATLEGSEILLQVVFGNEHIVVSTFTDGDTIYSDDITYDTFVAESDFNDTIDGLNANKQDTLVSGTNIKTINGESIVGSGNLTIGAEEIYEVDVPYYESSDIIGITTEMWNKLLVTPTISAKFSNTTFKSTLNKADLGMGNVLFYIGSSINFGTGAPNVVTVIFSGEGENIVGIPPNSCASTYSSLPISTSQLENDSNFISSDNLKTINGQSLVGSGDIEISGGGGSSSGAYAEVNHGTSDTTFTLTPNTFHVWDEVSSLTLTLGSETAGVANEFLFQFASGSEATSLTLSDDIKWTEELVIEANRIYQVSILKGLASVLSWKVEASITFPITLEMGDNGDIGIALYSYLQNTYGEPTSGTTLNEEIINNYIGAPFETIEYATYVGFTGYWLNGYAPYKMSWVLLEDGYLQRTLPAQEN